MKKHKIAIICPYFGELPENIMYTIKSMEYNANLDWFIFTDNNNFSNKKEANINFINISFEELKKIVYDKVGTTLRSIYKLCDYKVLYGKIFEDYIINYDFWGYCDLDMVFGDVQKFIDENDLLNNYDKIFDLGHFSIIKNEKNINEIYMKFYEYREILNSKYIYVLDESYKNHISINELLEKDNYKVYRNRECIADIKYQFKNFYTKNSKKSKFQYIKFEHGKLYLKDLINMKYNKEIVYAHFQKRKFSNYEIQKNIKCFYITPKGFISYYPCKNAFYRLNRHNLKLFFKVRLKRYIDNQKKEYKI